MSVLVFVRLFPHPGQEGRVESILRGMVEKSRQEPGCRRYDLFKASAASGGPIVCLIEKYADQAAVQAHRETSHYKAYRADIMSLLAQPIEVTVLEALDARDS
jgi:quinol monooxygenase YgiN